MVNVPSLQWREWTPSIDPSGYRTSSDSGELTAAGYVKDLSTSAGETAVFDALNISTSGQISNTKMMTAYVENWGDASGIYNMKVYLSSTDGFTDGTYRFLYNTGRHWWAEKQRLDENDDDMPTSQPATTNFLSTLGSGVLNKVDALSVPDSQVTEYLWMAVYVDVDVSVGSKGGPGTNDFRVRMVYDFS